MQAIAYFTPVTSVPVYGGSDGATFDQQKQALDQRCGIVVATPGKLISHLNLGYVKLEGLEFLVLDEADRMMDMGFVDDIKKIITFLPKERQTLLFSATMPQIRRVDQEILHDPVEITIALSKPAEGVDQQAYVIFDMQKAQILEHILNTDRGQCIVIFAGRKVEVRNLNRHLQKQGFNAQRHAQRSGQERARGGHADFRNRKLRILVATDVVSRGIDIDDIDLVINYDVPRDPEDYVHRVGRTARAARRAGDHLREREADARVRTHRGPDRLRGEEDAHAREIGRGPGLRPERPTGRCWKRQRPPP
jgi:ATP-dependent RNA helicase RhlE